MPRKWEKEEGRETSGSLTRKQFPPYASLLEGKCHHSSGISFTETNGKLALQSFGTAFDSSLGQKCYLYTDYFIHLIM